MNGTGWRPAAFAETVPGVYTADDGATRRGRHRRSVRAVLGGLAAWCRTGLSGLRRARHRGTRAPP
jgi:hypothetical protein